VPLFLVYGVYYGLTEGVEKRWWPTSRRRPPRRGVRRLPAVIASAPRASLVFAASGRRGAPAAFALGAALALASSAALLRLDLSPIMKRSHEENTRHNDDGVRSRPDGARAAFEPLGEVIVVAPAKEASAVGHALDAALPLPSRNSSARVRRGRHAHRLREHRVAVVFKGCRICRVGHQQGYNLGDD